VLLQTVARERELHLSGRDVTLSLQPMGQASGFVQGALAPLVQGAAVVTLPSFDATAVAQALVRHRVTRLLLAAPP
jgi:acyl-CoA synthetase (AMP-forming)/AMP-acid ligase II